MNAVDKAGNLSRRGFLHVTALAGGGMLIGAPLLAGRRARRRRRHRRRRDDPQRLHPPDAGRPSRRSWPRTPRSVRASRRCCRCSSPRSSTSRGARSASSRRTSDSTEVPRPDGRRQHGDADALPVDAPRGRRRPRDARRGRGQAVEDRSGEVHHRGRRRPLQEEVAVLRRAGERRGRDRAAQSPDRPAQGPRGLPDHRPGRSAGSTTRRSSPASRSSASTSRCPA